MKFQWLFEVGSLNLQKQFRHGRATLYRHHHPQGLESARETDLFDSITKEALVVTIAITNEGS